MSNGNILLVFASKHGQVEKIARRIAEILRSKGFAVTFARPDGTPDEIDLGPYDGVIVGASVYLGHHQRAVRRFVKHNAARLNAMPSAFFSVSGSAAGPGAREVEEARGYLHDFTGSTGWEPDLSAAIAGAIRYTAYGPITRRISRWISRRAGRETDTSRDWEYTDWSQVRGFAEAFARYLEARRSVGVS